MEKIIRIEETDFDGRVGFMVVTDEQTIKLGIEDGQSCCENYGYFMSEDDISRFIGAELLGIKLTDRQLKKIEEFDASNMYEGGVMFVDIDTSKGVLQFVAYNEHNGYYGHEACVISKQLNESMYL